MCVRERETEKLKNGEIRVYDTEFHRFKILTEEKKNVFDRTTALVQERREMERISCDA